MRHLLLISALALAFLPGTASAKHGGSGAKTVAGSCTKSATSKLKVKPDDGRLATEFEVEPGHVLVQPGTAGSGVFVIVSGAVVVELPSGRTVELRDGQVFGELSLLTDTMRTGRVRATTAVTGLAISRADFSGLLEDEPKIAVAMLPVLANRLIAAERG